MPDLAALVPSLQPEVLHRVIQTCGLEACGDLLALATRDQIRQLSDLDLWRPERPGQPEIFDAGRFAVWLEVLVDQDESAAARTLAALDREVVTTGLSDHIRVFERGTLSSFETTDGDLMADRTPLDRPTADLGGFVVIARRSDAWDAILAALAALQSEDPACFVEIMDGVRTVSNSTPESDGLDELAEAGEQLRHDARVGRDERREAQGYVSAGDARAFLQAARNSRAEAPTVNVRRGAGIIDPPGHALLDRRSSAHLERLRREMETLADHDPDRYAARSADIARLANTLVAGCSMQGRSFTPDESREAAAATCNLGLEHLGAPEGFLIHHDLIGIFQAGFTALHDDVVMHATDELARALGGLRHPDAMIQHDVDALRRDLLRHLRTGTPWLARQRMDVLATLDTPAWAALLGLVDECPVRHAIIAASHDPKADAVSATAFEFIADTAAIAEIRTFLTSLPALLRA